MNYLAHIYLSNEEGEITLGNFIADGVKGKKFIQTSNSKMLTYWNKLNICCQKFGNWDGGGEMSGDETL